MADAWGEWKARIHHRRYAQPVKTRRRCWCGCNRRASHAGFANGVCLLSPVCELAAARWVRLGWVRLKRPREVA